MNNRISSMRMLFIILVVLAIPLSILPVQHVQATMPAHSAVTPRKVVFYSVDGARPDMIQDCIDDGDCPNFATMVSLGAQGSNGLVNDLPPNTAPSHSSMATGAFTGDHGNVNNNFLKVTDPITAFLRRGFDWVTMDAQHLAEAAEAQGKKVVIISFAPTDSSRIKNPVIGFARFLSVRGIVSNFNPGVAPGFGPTSNPRFFLQSLVLATGWINQPPFDSLAPPRETSFSIAAGFTTYNARLFVFDSVIDGQAAYDRVIMTIATAPSSAPKDGSKAVVNLGVNQWGKVNVLHKTSSTATPRPAGFSVIPVDIAPDLSRFRFYFTSVSRVPALCAPTVCTTTVLNSIFLGATNLEDALSSKHGHRLSPDFAVLQNGFVPEEIYVSQGLQFYDWTSAATFTLVNTFQPDFLWNYMDVPDSFQHQFLALSEQTPLSPPDFDPVKATARAQFIRSAYIISDKLLGDMITAMGPLTDFFVVSDHGFSPDWRVINANLVLKNRGFATLAANGIDVVSPSQTRAVVTGASAFIYVNLQGREPGGVVPTGQLAALKSAIKTALLNLFDPVLDMSPTDLVFLREELNSITIDGFSFNLFHPTSSPDLIWIVKPPYQFDAAVAGLEFTRMPFNGQHGHRPTLVDLANNVNMHGIYYAMGPHIAHPPPIEGIFALDLAPTISEILNILPPEKASGRVIVGSLTKDLFAENALTKLVALKSEIAEDSSVTTELKNSLLAKIDQVDNKLHQAISAETLESEDGNLISARNMLQALKNELESQGLLSTFNEKISHVLEKIDLALMAQSFEVHSNAFASVKFRDPAQPSVLLYPEDPETIVSDSEDIPVELETTSQTEEEITVVQQ